MRVQEDADREHADYCVPCGGWTNHTGVDHGLMVVMWERDDLRNEVIRLRQSLGIAWGAFLGALDDGMWDDISVLSPVTWERLRKLVLGESG